MLRWLVVTSLVVGLGCGGDANQGPDSGFPFADARLDAESGDIYDQLRAIPRMQVTERPGEDGYRVFDLAFDQPVNHNNPTGEWFTQHMTLMHRDENAPMILATTGYDNYLGARRVELTQLFSANQLVVEHREFGQSVPAEHRWEHLTIRQAANDHHRIVQELRPIYTGAWVSTGASKGGMTSIYHRRFFPDDVDATVAYVAPLSFGAPDGRYSSFFNIVGVGDCAQRVRDFQRDVLQNRRATIEPRIVQWISSMGADSYTIAGSIEAAFESSVIGLQWAYWQYYGQPWCNAIPTAQSSDDQVFEFLQDMGVASSSDSRILRFQPYYYQASTELGYPENNTSHVSDLATTPWAGSTLPDVPVVYDGGAAMTDIDNWVQTEGERLMFIYGQWDPWTGGEFRLGNATDSYSYTVPQGTHGALITQLPDLDQVAAFNNLARWTGLSSTALRSRRTIVPAPRLTPVPLPR